MNRRDIANLQCIDGWVFATTIVCKQMCSKKCGNSYACGNLLLAIDVTSEILPSGRGWKRTRFVSHFTYLSLRTFLTTHFALKTLHFAHRSLPTSNLAHRSLHSALNAHFALAHRSLRSPLIVLITHFAQWSLSTCTLLIAQFTLLTSFIAHFAFLILLTAQFTLAQQCWILYVIACFSVPQAVLTVLPVESGWTCCWWLLIFGTIVFLEHMHAVRREI